MQKQKQQSTPSPISPKMAKRTRMPVEYEAVRHCRLSSSQNIPTPHWHFPRMLATSPPNHSWLGVISSSKSWQRRFPLSQAQSLLVRHIIPSRILHSFQSSKSQPPEWLHSTNFPVAFVTWGKEGRTEVNIDINQYHPPYRQPRPWLQQRPLSLYCVMILRRILKSWILKSWISKKSHLLSFPLSYPEPQPGEERSVETRVTSFLVDSRSTNIIAFVPCLFLITNCLPLHYTTLLIRNMSHIRVPPTLEAAQAVAPATTAFFAPREENDLEEDLEENLEDDPEELDLEKKPPLGLPPFLPRTTTRRRAIRRNQSNFIFSWKSFNR